MIASISAQAIASGLSTGAAYGLLAMGLVVAFRTTRVLNLALGESYVLAAMTVVGLVALDLPLGIATAGGLVAGVMFSVGLQLVLLRTRRQWHEEPLILLTLAVALVVEGALFVFVENRARSFDPLFHGRPMSILGATVAPQALALFVIGVTLSLLVSVVLTRTRVGKQLEASSQNPDAASLLGINVSAMHTLSFAVAGLLSASAAVLLVPLTAVDFHSGLGFTLRGFVAAALGGLTHPSRALLAGLLLGLFEAIVADQAGVLYRNPVIFGALVVAALVLSRNIRYGGAARA
jgi:branched-subunit amino acid ABC-type transport system permease component